MRGIAFFMHKKMEFINHNSDRGWNFIECENEMDLPTWLFIIVFYRDFHLFKAEALLGATIERVRIRLLTISHRCFHRISSPSARYVSP